MKAQISIVEMIISAIIIFTTLTILFTKVSYQNRWDEALILLKGRDAVLTIDRIGKLYNYSFDSDSLKNFLNKSFKETNLVYQSETEGTLKQVINVACNCTQEQINNLSLWFSDIRVNNRTISLRFLDTYLDNLSAYTDRSDVLLIWKYRDLTPYSQSLRDYLAKENGIVEIMDFANNPENIQSEIFGIGTAGTWANVLYDNIPKPNTSANITYQTYKMFYHMPLPLYSPENVASISGCPQTQISSGNFTINNTDGYKIYKFWICNSTNTYFNNGIANITVKVGDKFTLGSYDFFLNYIDGYTKIGVSFEQIYNFSDFCRTPSNKRIIPFNNENSRTFMIGVVQGAGAVPAFCVILNATGKAAWISDFSRNGLTYVDDDHRNLLLSILLSTSNKNAMGVLSPGIKVGYETSYINSVNDDMFEIYTFKLGLGYPY